MVDLLLLDSFTGKQTKTMRTKRIKELQNRNADDYLNILLLFIDYKRASGSVNKSKLNRDRNAIVKKLYQTYPFNKAQKYVNVFTPKDQPDLKAVYSPDKESMSGIAVQESIKKIVQQYSYQSFIENGAPWLRGPSYKPNRSEGCIGIVSGKTSQKTKGVFFSADSVVEPWASKQGVRKQKVGRFFVAKGPSSKRRRIYLSETFIHELGHALNLADEYENDPPSSPPWQEYTISESPNVISTRDLLDVPDDVYAHEVFMGIWFEDLKHRFKLPTVDEINPKNIPWEKLLGNFEGLSKANKLAKLNLEPHKSRKISKSKCKALKAGWEKHLTHPGLCNVADNSDYHTNKYIGPPYKLPIGLYEGGDTEIFNIFRPQRSCNMRSSHHRKSRFCWVCERWILYRIYATSYVKKVSSFKKWLNIYMSFGIQKLEIIFREHEK